MERPRSLPTKYAGRIFRSRLEARWASVFDSFGVPWEYEPEGIATTAGNYLPDFRIRVPQNKGWDHYQWFEVKPRRAEHDARHAALAADAPVLVARGLPTSYGWFWDEPALELYVQDQDEVRHHRVAFAELSALGSWEMVCSLGDNRIWHQDDMTALDDSRLFLAVFCDQCGATPPPAAPGVTAALEAANNRRFTKRGLY